MTTATSEAEVSPAPVPTMQAPPPSTILAEWSPEQVAGQLEAIKTLMQKSMKEDEDYGVIPGCKKPSLLKPGAEKLGLMFRLSPGYQITHTPMENGHREITVVCTLTHIPTGRVMGSGLGSCSTMETKFRWRQMERKCPACNGPFIIKGKVEYGGGWICFTKKGGCGCKFLDGDKTIEGQEIGRKENEDLADQYNTVLKMAKKRAHVDAALTVTAASQIFTQDVEEMAHVERAEPVKAQTAAKVPDQPPSAEAAKWNDWALKQVRRAANLEQLEKIVAELQAKGAQCWTEAVKAEANKIYGTVKKTNAEMENKTPPPEDDLPF